MKLIYTKKEVNKMNNYLQKLNINESLKKEINSYRESYPVSQELLYRIPKPDNLYYGDEIWNQAVTALLCGENILLVGHKATGKIFLRKIWQQLLEDLSGIFLFT